MLCAQHELSVDLYCGVELALGQFTHLQVHGVDLLLCEGYVVEVCSLFVLMVVLSVSVGFALMGEERKAADGDESHRHNE